MRIFLTLSSGDEFGRHTCMAQTSDPAIVRHVIQGLLTNCLLEADEQDTIYGECFLNTASTLIAMLTAQIRTDAVRAAPEEAKDIY